ncbi:hypothetical protein [Bifidobacterium sp. ESL0745]|uniref:hypothetical protein n=1 Tax=Bifidobacterium sp. ESL0745 TaxID=2983226 RepID=UPI0023F67F9E|nr:hypothetical protein [Bifidobacterium sp. ESL0745]MDF7665753.1 hypothetical protein [Bifidobacterium sp. ESL0745]
MTTPANIYKATQPTSFRDVDRRTVYSGPVTNGPTRQSASSSDAVSCTLTKSTGALLPGACLLMLGATAVLRDRQHNSRPI